MRKGPDGKTIKPAGEGQSESTRKVQRKSIKDRIAGAEEDTDAVVTHIAGSTAPDIPSAPGASSPDDDATAIAGPPGGISKPPANAGKPTAPTENSSDKPEDLSGDPNVTQVFRPTRSEDDEEDEMNAPSDKPGDFTISDPVVGWLVIAEGPGRGAALPIGYGNNRIGRTPTEQICLDFGDDQISRENHAVVTYDGKHRKFYVQQGGGRNLTHVDDELVMVPVEVKGGETITLGTTRLRFVPFCGPDFDWQEQ